MSTSNVFLFLTTNSDSGVETAVGGTRSESSPGGFQSLSDTLRDDRVTVEYRPPDVLANCANPLRPTIVLYHDRLFQHTVTDTDWIDRLAHTLHTAVSPHLDPERTTPKGNVVPGPRRRWRPK
ncbi:hypothetical protein [Haloglycomyces albus]|uniref:hypothetical protein n=1 Tax=Haloglycomyces albus TaxID=526067 RepID=UPI0012EC4D6F|nr:hypothetical protein [Haloglycomyces albus]